MRLRRAHLVGIAGSGMRALAEVLAGWGCRVSGSDCGDFAGVERLAAGGVRLFQGHAAEHIPPKTELVVYSDAVPASNPELRRAAELDIPTMSYFQMLGRLCADRHTVAVAGTHGKSTTTAMAAHVLIEAGRDPTVFCGATPLGAASGGRAGGISPLLSGEGQGVRAGCHAHACRGHVKSATTFLMANAGATLHAHDKRGHGTQHTECAYYDHLMLIEACEYRANFLHLRPQHAAILGIEPDHFDCYDSLDEIEWAFRQFAASVPPEGLLLVRHDCASTRRATAGLACRIESFGTNPDADWSTQQIVESRGLFHFMIHHLGQPLCEVRLRVPGRHNVLNALAAAGLAWANGATPGQIAAGLDSFAGLHRRLEVLGTWRGVTLVDDYAHHPTEVTAALAAVRCMFPHRRVWCVLQPHQASRTARLLDELAASLQNADRVLVTEIFRAREGDPQPGEVTAADLARRAAARGVEVLPGRTAEEIADSLETHLVPGDVLVTLGAGDMERLRPKMRDEG